VRKDCLDVAVRVTVLARTHFTLRSSRPRGLRARSQGPPAHSQGSAAQSPHDNFEKVAPHLD
jgi:hypothetical protein